MRQLLFNFIGNCSKTVGQRRLENINLSARAACRGTRLFNITYEIARKPSGKEEWEILIVPVYAEIQTPH